ncbi:MAG: hypothetical protein Q9183_005902, partial [Haloplaca sp. 2 TL-2023]
LVGWLADQGSSRKISFLSGLTMLLVSTLIFAIGTSPVLLLLARCLQGASAGIVYTVGLALLVDTVGQDEVGAWMGSALSGMSIGLMIGPFTGGIIYLKAGYLAVFATILAIIAMDFAARLFMIEKQSAKKWSLQGGYGTFSTGPHPVYRQTSSRDLVSTQEDGLIDHSTPNGQDATNVTRANSGKQPFHEPDDPQSPTPSSLTRFLKTTTLLLKSRGILAAMYGGFIQATIICAFDSILPLFVHKTFGWDSSGGGSIFLTLTLPSLAAPLAGAMSDRWGARVVVSAGFGISTLTLASLGFVGIGVTMMLPALAVDMYHIVSRLSHSHTPSSPNSSSLNSDHTHTNNQHTTCFALAYGLFNTALALGTMLGPALAGLVYDARGWTAAMLAMAAFCASGVVPV